MYYYELQRRSWPGPDRQPYQLPVIDAGGQPFADGPYDKELPSYLAIPDKPNQQFHRGNFCCRAPQGCNTPYPPGVPILTWDLVRMARADQIKFLNRYVYELSFTHIDLSIPQTKNFGKDLTDLKELCKLCKQYGLFIIMNCYGGDDEVFDADIKPWLDELLPYLSILIVCWQIDKYYGADLVDVILTVVNYAQPRGLEVGTQWLNEACAFWPYPQYGIYNRFDFANFMIGKMQYQYWQTNTEASVNSIQWSLVKVLQAYNTPAHSMLVATEYDAQAEFDDPKNRTEIQGADKGYIVMCARYNDSMPVRGGFMNDAYYPSGKIL